MKKCRMSEFCLRIFALDLQTFWEGFLMESSGIEDDHISLYV